MPRTVAYLWYDNHRCAIADRRNLIDAAKPVKFGDRARLISHPGDATVQRTARLGPMDHPLSREPLRKLSRRLRWRRDAQQRLHHEAHHFQSLADAPVCTETTTHAAATHARRTSHTSHVAYRHLLHHLDALAGELPLFVEQALSFSDRLRSRHCEMHSLRARHVRAHLLGRRASRGCARQPALLRLRSTLDRGCRSNCRHRN
ncbi:MAG TPA: hypothetical protein VFQ95_09700 [Rhodanobacteraceae bacterium]|nr:hypothetical protein [Rhodanobacteraceae bacterium]